MNTPPADTRTVTTEGQTVAEALALAAKKLKVDASRVQHTLDRAHFRNPDGGMRAVDTVKIIAWAGEEGAAKAPTKTAAKAPTKTAAKGALWAEEWVRGLIGKMGYQGNVSVEETGEMQARVKVDSPDGRHLVGRQGTTIKAIQGILDDAIARKEPGWTIRIDILGGDREERRRDDDRGGRGDRGRDDRGDRRERGRDDRGDRRDRGGDRGRDDRGGGRRGEEDVRRLRRLAQKLAQQVIETGEAVTIQKELNSFERRVVHVEIQEMDGVHSVSVADGDFKKVEIRPGKPSTEE